MQNITMRVVGGKYARRNLTIDVENKDIRPTKDMVRQGVFNALGLHVLGKNVLDLFAGTGALGVEALSRGALSASFVDLSPKALKLIELNTKFVEEPVEIVRLNYQSFIANEPKNKFDLIFLDPPYHLDVLAILEEILKASIIGRNAIIVLESDKPLAISSELGKIRTYKYGITHVTIIWRNL